MSKAFRLRNEKRGAEQIFRSSVHVAFRLSTAIVAGFLATSGLTIPATADPVEIHYAPVENLEHLDVALLRSARSKIDFTAYSLTDWPIIDALIDAHQRGVAVRIVLDPSQHHAFDHLHEIDDAIRMKAPGPYMHLKSYAIDGLLLRSGSANLTASGLKQQDNDIIVIHEPSAARVFDARFEQIWAAGKPIADTHPATASRKRGLTLAKAAPASAPEGCTIKGNVNRKGERIYHLPGGRDYDRVHMDKEVGERWFCSEAEAVAAGWRKAGSK
jgi:phosphatidylserine/phosphatidylglycerophosphate/cardiolipin synthase-like enzyme